VRRPRSRAPPAIDDVRMICSQHHAARVTSPRARRRSQNQ
jgi:hypothetical protein